MSAPAFSPESIKPAFVFDRIYEGANGAKRLRVDTNVPQLARLTPNLPFDWQPGCAAADVALNMLEAVLQSEGYHGQRIECPAGSCFQIAYDMHLSYLNQVVSKLAFENTVVLYRQVVAWIRKESVNAGREARDWVRRTYDLD